MKKFILITILAITASFTAFPHEKQSPGKPETPAEARALARECRALETRCRNLQSAELTNAYRHDSIADECRRWRRFDQEAEQRHIADSIRRNAFSYGEMADKAADLTRVFENYAKDLAYAMERK